MCGLLLPRYPTASFPQSRCQLCSTLYTSTAVQLTYIRIRIRTCISVKQFQRINFDVSQKPLIQKMHTEPEILNRRIEGYDAGFIDFL